MVNLQLAKKKKSSTNLCRSMRTDRITLFQTIHHERTLSQIRTGTDITVQMILSHPWLPLQHQSIFF